MGWKKRAMSEMLDGAIRRVVVIGNGFAGAENQSIGLVRALGHSNRLSLYRVTRPQGGINRWFKWLPVSIHKKLDSAVRKICGNSRFQSLNHSIVMFIFQIQHPRFLLNRFDLVITPRHDYYPLTPHAQRQLPWFLRRWVTPWEPPGRNVVLTVGALHQADSAALRVAASAWHNELATLPKPLLVVNIGGPTGNCPYGVDLAKNLVVMLQNVLWSCGTIRISFSRRTPEKISKILFKEFSTNPKVQIWDGEGPNPHMGHLAWADAFVITADSVSMLSEACSTGKPVYVIGAELCTWKFADFQNSLQKQGVARPFTGMENITESWFYPPLNDTAEAASQVIAALAQRGWTIRAQ
ncbi:hypothetical protein TSUD_339890 [Trifolium subterraneum]|nr:hypothetical protein TSUD_339890 [Trifolium subterraneum]